MSRFESRGTCGERRKDNFLPMRKNAVCTSYRKEAVFSFHVVDVVEVYAALECGLFPEQVCFATLCFDYSASQYTSTLMHSL